MRLLEVTAADGTVETIEAAHYLIATGSRPWAPAIEGLDGVDFFTSTSAMELSEVPDSPLVLGGGYVALEMAQLFARLGSKVTLLVRSRLASKEEPEVSKSLQEIFADEGIRVVRRAIPTRVTRDPGTGQIVPRPRSRRRAGVPCRRDPRRARPRPGHRRAQPRTVQVKTGAAGEVVVTDQLQSSNPRVWAAGDVTGHPEFVYVEPGTARWSPRTPSRTPAPRSTTPGCRGAHSEPCRRRVGMTEKEVIAAGIRCDCRVLPLEYVPRALVNRDTRGFIKMVANADTGEILGLTAVAKDAGELAAAGVHILGKTITEVADAWAPYLTTAEGIRIMPKAFTTDVSMLSCCA